MAMEFKRRLPIPMEIREEMPLSAELTAKKQAFDAEVAKVFTGEDARKVLIIGPCSADREDSVLEYMNRLAKVAGLTGYDPGIPTQRLTLQAAVIGARLLPWPERQDL